jgi:UDP-N-acetylglucosamine 4,6-dehydratase
MNDVARTAADPVPGTAVIRSFDVPALDLKDKAILVTGGTGSFGKAFVRTVLRDHAPRKLIVLSRDELKQYEMAQEFSQDRHPCMRYFIGDVRDATRLELAMGDVDYVVHAAALKQVPTAEYNPIECVRTNIHGAENVVTAAIRAGVDKVIALSTDKAANPVNLYGASKLASDKIFIGGNHLSGKGGPRYAVVRYGNVLGSRGSVVPYFQRLIDEGADSLPITDPRMTRFWITLTQGVQLVLSSLAMMRGGETFVPKIPSMRITEMAKALAPDLPQHTVGIRPGEKLHEVLITEDDAREAVELEDRYVVGPAFKHAVTETYVEDGAKPLSERFRYASDTNPEWLDADGLRALLAAA